MLQSYTDMTGHKYLGAPGLLKSKLLISGKQKLFVNDAALGVGW